MEPEAKPLDVLTIGEVVVDFISAEKTDTLSNASTFRRYLSEEAISRTRVVHASTFALSREPCRSAVLWAFRKAREMGQIVSLDPNNSRRVWPDQKEARRVIRGACRYVNVTKLSADAARRAFGPDPRRWHPSAI